jgi:hypothetical protein
MATSLRDIPGAQRPSNGRGRKSQRALWEPSRSTKVDMTPGSLRINRPRRRGFNRPTGQIDLFLWALVLGALAVAGWLGHAFWSATRVDVGVAGIEDGQALTPENAAGLAIALTLPSTDDLFRSTLTVDGVEVLEDLAPADDDPTTTVTIRPQDLVERELVEHALDEGEHEITLSVGRLLLGDSTFTWRYVVDSVAPILDVPPSLDPVPIADAVTVSGTVEEGATLTYAGEPLDNDDGSFEVEFGTPPAGALHFTATDEAGNQTSAQVVVPVIYPETSKAIHVSGAAWANDELKAGVMDLIDRGLIDTVELDLKDESGIVSYESTLPEAIRIGAVTGDYDLAEAVRELDAKGVRVIGRLVAFRDAKYADAAWADGRTDEVLQTPDGDKLATYGGFTNYAHPQVRQYNLDIALEAVSLGVKDILWDYIRRPEGEPSSMVVPGLVGPSSASVTEFLAQTQGELRQRGAYQGASVFGIAAAAGDSIAQDVPAMAQVVDYLAPMLYPSHWGAGMYRVPDPINQPGEIIDKSLADFQRVTAGTGVRFLPWLQDFTLYGVPYGEAEVRAQIAAAKALGVEGYLLWNPNVRYTSEALDPIDP